MLKDYLRQMMRMFEKFKDKQPNYYFYRWLLKKGKRRKTKKFSKKELKLIQDMMRRSAIFPQAKQCYYVAQMMMLSGLKGLKYIEGYAVNIIPTEHAWLEYKGKVLDPVWGCLNHSESPDGLSADPKCEYFGVEVPLEYIAENIVNTHMAQPILPIMFTKENEK